jgi:hypothetical protein
MSFTSIITMTRSFLKREFAAPCLTWESGSRKWRSLPQAVRFKNGWQNIATELQAISALVEEILTMAKQSYSAALTASHMGHLAYEHNVTIMQLRNRNVELQNEIRSWVLRSSQDSTAAMILAEENVVLAKANTELSARMQELNGRRRKQTEILGGLLTVTDFGLPSTVLNDVLTSRQALLGLLDLPGTYSRLIGELREPIASERQGRTEHSSSDHPCDAKRLGRFDRTAVKSSLFSDTISTSSTHI